MARLHVIVVGAGIGGLAAAAALRQNGHQVEIFESSHFEEEIGAGIGLPPNAVKILKYLSCNLEELHCVPYEGVVTFFANGSEGLPQTLHHIARRFGENWLLCHRVDLHAALKNLACGASVPKSTNAQMSGPPAVLHLGKKVVDYNATLGAVTLENGTVQYGDLIVAADGIRSACRSILPGNPMKVEPSNIAAYRWMVDRSIVKTHPELDWVTAGPSGPKIVTTADSRVLIVYPCRDGKLLNVLGIHSDHGQDGKDWNRPATQAEVTDMFSDCHPQFIKFISLAENIRLWQMRCTPVLNAWVDGSIALLGDAAHATLPTFGQGFALALEDAITLGVLFSSESAAINVPERLKAYQLLRKQRAEYVAGQSRDQIIFPTMRGLFYRSPEMQQDIMGYDARKVAETFFQSIPS
ncbi:FAD/NAD(P)-binding domain-containing protein [Favolaschia claudopus]|uniref:FAD/NAD(P)-binding domain-containing protein n=1 Tax=Favolaschia claudopus TaxID=2862362 RepID=A0AAW0EDE7_9AGAR